MALAIIRGATASGAGVTLTVAAGSPVDYSAIFQSARVRATLPQIDATTYSNETNGNFIAGIERLTIDLAGLMTKGDAKSGTTLPLSGWQAATVKVIYDSGCYVSATANATDGDLNRPAGTMGLITQQFVSTGSFSVTWVTA